MVLYTRQAAWASIAVTMMTITGCSHSADAPPVTQVAVPSVQNNPNISPQMKTILLQHAQGMQRQAAVLAQLKQRLHKHQ